MYVYVYVHTCVHAYHTNCHCIIDTRTEQLREGERELWDERQLCNYRRPMRQRGYAVPQALQHTRAAHGQLLVQVTVRRMDALSHEVRVRLRVVRQAQQEAPNEAPVLLWELTVLRKQTLS